MSDSDEDKFEITGSSDKNDSKGVVSICVDKQMDEEGSSSNLTAVSWAISPNKLPD